MKLKMCFFSVLVATLFITACEKESLLTSEQQVGSENPELQFRTTGNNDCPRTDIDIDGPPDMHDLASELTTAHNCGQPIISPDCGNQDPVSEFTTVLVEEWCFTTSPGSCDCNDLPETITIADQDALIAQALSLLDAQFATCSSSNNTVLSFFAYIEDVIGCEDVVIKLFARGSVSCCPK